jgi:hypothetical protein
VQIAAADDDLAWVINSAHAVFEFMGDVGDLSSCGSSCWRSYYESSSIGVSNDGFALGVDLLDGSVYHLNLTQAYHQAEAAFTSTTTPSQCPTGNHIEYQVTAHADASGQMCPGDMEDTVTQYGPPINIDTGLLNGVSESYAADIRAGPCHQCGSPEVSPRSRQRTLHPAVSCGPQISGWNMTGLDLRGVWQSCDRRNSRPSNPQSRRSATLLGRVCLQKPK